MSDAAKPAASTSPAVSASEPAAPAVAGAQPTPSASPNERSERRERRERCERSESDDIVVLGPPTADGAGVHVLRAREERIETGELRAMTDGKPVVGEVVTLAPRADNPRICDVKDSYRPPPTALSAAGSKKGPAQVATKEYRDNWDEIFGKVEPRHLN